MALVRGLVSSKVEISIGVFGLTRAGNELFYLLDGISNDEYFYDLAEEIEKKNFRKVKVSVHQNNFIDAGKNNYEKTTLREFPTKSEATKE